LPDIVAVYDVVPPFRAVGLVAGYLHAYHLRHARAACSDLKVRDIYAAGCASPDSIVSLCDDSYVRTLAVAVSGSLGGKVSVAPRLFLKNWSATYSTVSISSPTSTLAATMH
jgi:hypothetical protein